MTTLWQILKPEDKLKLGNLYRVLAGFEFTPPDNRDRPVKCETKLEPIEEIDKLIRQRPHYSRGIDSRG